VYNKDTVGYSCEQRWFNLFVDIQAQQDAPTQDKDTCITWFEFQPVYRLNGFSLSIRFIACTIGYVEAGHDLLLPNPGLFTVPSVHCTLWSCDVNCELTFRYSGRYYVEIRDVNYERERGRVWVWGYVAGQLASNWTGWRHIKLGNNTPTYFTGRVLASVTHRPASVLWNYSTHARAAVYCVRNLKACIFRP
jgi:hypothetical protein